MSQKGTFIFSTFFSVETPTRRNHLSPKLPLLQARAGNSSVGTKVLILLPAKSKAKFSLYEGSQLISCKLSEVVRVSS